MHDAVLVVASSLLGACLTLLGLFGFGIWHQRKHGSNAERHAKKCRAEYIRGLSCGYADLAPYRFGRGAPNFSFHGFAESCRQCDEIVTGVLHVSREYYRCPSCGHRNPAPLARQPKQHSDA